MFAVESGVSTCSEANWKNFGASDLDLDLSFDQSIRLGEQGLDWFNSNCDILFDYPHLIDQVRHGRGEDAVEPRDFPLLL